MTVDDALTKPELHPLFDGIIRGDMDTVEAAWADDIQVWHVGDPAPLDKADALTVVRMLIEYSSERDYRDVRRRDFPGGCVQQHVLTGTTTAGVPFAGDVCIVMLERADGRTYRIDEYFDPRAFDPILKLIASDTAANDERS